MYNHTFTYIPAYTSYFLFPGILLQAVSCVITIITCTHVSTIKYQLLKEVKAIHYNLYIIMLQESVDVVVTLLSLFFVYFMLTSLVGINKC